MYLILATAINLVVILLVDHAELVKRGTYEVVSLLSFTTFLTFAGIACDYLRSIANNLRDINWRTK
jgi:hypothetical protein